MSRGRRHIAVIAVLALLIGVTILLLWTRFGRGPDAPSIGVSVSEDWFDRMQVHRFPYDRAIQEAGGNVVTIEPKDLPRLDEILETVDGLVLAGGGDVDPELYGGEPGEGFLVRRERDDFEIELLNRAERHGLPVLAICRGIQVLAVSEGGRLRDLAAAKERHAVTIKSLQAHEVTIEPGSRLHAELGPGPLKVSSFHRQGVETAGPRLKVVARAEDGVIEAVELPGERLVIGIQWHPELEVFTEQGMAPFRMLLEAAEQN